MRKQVDDYKRRLIRKYVSNTVSEKELQVFMELLRLGELDEYIDEDMDRRIRTIRDEKKRRGKKQLWVKWMAVCCLLFTLSLGSYFYFSGLHHVRTDDRMAETVIAPGKNRATLILGDGSKVILSEEQEGVIMNAEEIKYADGTNVSGVNQVKGQSFNTISTPRGGQYQIILSDGTKVWLNAASSLRYPSVFPDGERVVELTGEGYFEVAESRVIGDRHQKRKKVPFRVITINQEVEVLGTHFNINAYEDEKSVRTTLLEGRVKVKSMSSNSSKELLPGLQSILGPSDWKISKANIEESISWKKGIFYFKDTPIEELLRQVSRWYDIDVAYKGVIPSEFYTGEMSRNVSLNVLLEFLRGSGIRYDMEGRKLIIGK